MKINQEKRSLLETLRYMKFNYIEMTYLFLTLIDRKMNEFYEYFGFVIFILMLIS